MSKIVHALTICLSLNCYLAIEENYYWRPFAATIPKDAVIAGQDIDNKNVYVGKPNKNKKS